MAVHQHRGFIFHTKLLGNDIDVSVKTSVIS